jgi:hypothetical protein
VTLPTTERVPTLLAAARRIEEAGVAISELGVRGPSLDDVFLTLTGSAGALTPAASPALHAEPSQHANQPQPHQATA